MKAISFFKWTVLLGVIHFIAGAALSANVDLNLKNLSLIIFATVLITSFSFSLFLKFKKNFKDQLITLIIGLFTMKLFIYLIIAGIIIWMDKSNANTNVVILLITYLMFTMYETYVKWTIVQSSH